MEGGPEVNVDFDTVASERSREVFEKGVVFDPGHPRVRVFDRNWNDGDVGPSGGVEYTASKSLASGASMGRSFGKHDDLMPGHEFLLDGAEGVAAARARIPIHEHGSSLLSGFSQKRPIRHLGLRQKKGWRRIESRDDVDIGPMIRDEKGAGVAGCGAADPYVEIDGCGYVAGPEVGTFGEVESVRVGLYVSHVVDRDPTKLCKSRRGDRGLTQRDSSRSSFGRVGFRSGVSSFVYCHDRLALLGSRFLVPLVQESPLRYATIHR